MNKGGEIIFRPYATERDWVIHCECGKHLPFDKTTECNKCGAHYHVDLNQTVPPIEANK